MTKVRKIYETPLTLNYKFSQEDFQLHRIKLGRKTIFTSQGQLALMFLKSYTSLSDKKLVEQLNVNYEYQFFCGISISPDKKISNYKIVSEISSTNN